MKNYFDSGNGHPINSLTTNWFSDIAEIINKSYKRQMELSVEMGNQILNNRITKEKPAEDFFTMKIFKNNAELFGKNIEIYSDFFQNMTSLTTDTFFSKKDTSRFSDKMFENIVGIYEKEVKQLKEFNNYFLEILEKNTDGTSLGSIKMIENFKKHIEENLDNSLNVYKSILKPDNKKLLEEINTQMDSIIKSNLTFWSDLIISMSKVSKEKQKDTAEKPTVKESRREHSVVNHKK